jgi:two-component system, OmpR family, KDP operon response regulator KdpE
MRSDLVLVCDPSPQVQRALHATLRGAGYGVVVTASGREALASIDRELPEAIILELALLDMPGTELCRQVRRRAAIAILVLAAIDDESAMIEALESGADDYLIKPLRPGELIARLAARLRFAPSELRVQRDGLVIDLAGHRVTIDGEPIHLTATEFALLRVLATARGPVSSRTLAAQVWGPIDADPTLRVRSHIANLRAKLGRNRRRSLIETELGVGYRLSPPEPLGQSRASGPMERP